MNITRVPASMPAALAARDAALRRVDEHADPEWKDRALAAVRRTCEQMQDWISDDIWEVGGLGSTHEDRALGPIVRKASRLGWCRRVDGASRPSVRSHGSSKPVWESLLYAGAKRLCECGCGAEAPAGRQFLKGHHRVRPLADKFWEKVEKTPTCWLWTGGLNASGYGVFRALGETLAHRVSYRMFVGDIPDGMQLDHVAAFGCQNRHCVNPAHLEPVTPAENQRRGLKGELRTHCVNGHAYLPDNLIIEPRPSGATARRCKTCRTEQQAAARQRKRTNVLAAGSFGDGRLFTPPPADAIRGVA